MDDSLCLVPVFDHTNLTNAEKSFPKFVPGELCVSIIKTVNIFVNRKTGKDRKRSVVKRLSS